MPYRRTLVAALLVMGIAPATANATPTVTATGDAGSPVTLSPSAPTGIRQMDVNVTVAVPRADTNFFQAQVLDGGGGPATPLSDCFDRRDTASLQGSPSYHGNGTYTVLVRYASNATCSTVTRETRFQYAVSAGAAVTPPPGKLRTRKANSFVITTFPLGVTLNPGATSYEIRYKRNGVVQPDGSLAGTTQSAFVDTTSGLANFSFAKPGRYVIVARAERDGFFSGWSAPTVVNAIAPFDLGSVKFPDHKGPSYKLRGRIREHSARGKVTIYLAKGKKGGRFHKLGKAKIGKTGKFTKRFTVRRPGTYRLRYVFKGSSTVAAGRVTERIVISRRYFF
jgi:hypothetical protein